MAMKEAFVVSTNDDSEVLLLVAVRTFPNLRFPDSLAVARFWSYTEFYDQRVEDTSQRYLRYSGLCPPRNATGTSKKSTLWERQ